MLIDWLTVSQEHAHDLPVVCDVVTITVDSITGEKLDAILAALDGGMSKAAVCRNFGVKRTTLIETLARVGWPESRHSGT